MSKAQAPQPGQSQREIAGWCLGCSIRALPFPYNRNSCLDWERGLQAETGPPLPQRTAFQPGRGCGLTPRRPVCGDRSPPEHQEARLLLSVFLGLECHPLESLSLRDAGSEWALESCRGLWCWGGVGKEVPTCRAARPLVGGSLRHF